MTYFTKLYGEVENSIFTGFQMVIKVASIEIMDDEIRGSQTQPEGFLCFNVGEFLEDEVAPVA